MKHLSSLLSILVLFLIPFASIGQAYTVTVAEHAVDIVEGHTTYRLYVDMVNPEDKLSSISGGGDTPLILTTTDGFYNDEFGGTVASAINPAFYSFFPTLLGDSWITIGIESQPEGDQAAVSIVEGGSSLVAHFDAASPLSGTDILIDDSTGSAWYTLSDASNGLPDSETMRTMFMQLSIPTGGEICATVNVQIFGMGIGANEILATYNFCGEGTFSPVSEEEVSGCMDSFACNYDASATEDDGSCEYASCLGCTDAEACNYDAEAIYNDGTCEYTSCGTAGCTNDSACNYNAEATYEDGTCEYSSCIGCTDESADNYDPEATIDNGSCEFLGCTDMEACNYDAAANAPDGSCTYAGANLDCDGNCLVDTDGDGVCDEFEVAGCQDIVACNYNSEASDEDGSCDYCSCGNSGGLLPGMQYTMTIEEHVSDIIPGTVTYRFYANMVNEDDFLSSVYGNNENPFILETSDGFYNSTYGGATADNVNPAFFSFFPELEADSWVTIGIDSTPVGSEVGISTVESTVQPWVNSFQSPSESDGADILMNDETGGAWFVLNGSPNGLPDAVNNRVLFMQLTTSGTFSGTAHIQVFENGVGSEDIRSSFDFDGPGTYNPSVEDNACGCTDPEASNYDDSADYDDGSCDYNVYGCTDEMACNFNGMATEDDGSCEFPFAGYDCNGDCLNDADMDGVCDEFEIAGCSDMMACNFNEMASDDDGSCTFAESGYDCNGNCLVDSDGDGVCDEFEVTGCQNMDACNYSMEATDDDGSCVFADAGYDCDGVCLSDADADGVCDEFEVSDCTDMMACNYNVEATDDDGSCTYAESGYDCEGMCLADADMDGVCDEFEVLGCEDELACNYSAEATEDDGSCTFAEANYDCDGNCLNDADMDGICDELEVAGCMDMTACNYNEAATDDDGSCTFAEANYDCDGNCLNDADGDGVCDELEVAGCTDPEAENYSADATDDDGSCYFCDVVIAVDEVVNDVEGTGGSISITVSGGTPDYIIGWTGPDGFTSEDEDITGMGGLYTVTVTDSNGCVTTLDIEMEVVISVVELMTFPMEAYPNPATSELWIASSSWSGMVEVSIYDATGRMVYNQDIQGSNQNIRLDVSTYAGGIYNVMVRSGMKRAMEQVIIQ